MKRRIPFGDHFAVVLDVRCCDLGVAEEVETDFAIAPLVPRPSATLRF